MRYPRPKYLDWFIKSPKPVLLENGEKVIVYAIDVKKDDPILDEWSKHIVRHYVPDDYVRDQARRLRITEKEYLAIYRFDIKGKDVSGNFAEILFADFVEFVLGYEVPRYKLFNNYPGNPQQGIDLFGFKFHIDNKTPDPKDEALFMEVKAALSGTDFETITNAVADIDKREDKNMALILDNARARLEALNCTKEVEMIDRYQDTEKPYVKIKAAGAITSSKQCIDEDLIGIEVKSNTGVMIHAVYGPDLWDLARDLFARACK